MVVHDYTRRRKCFFKVVAAGRRHVCALCRRQAVRSNLSKVSIQTSTIFLHARMLFCNWCVQNWKYDGMNSHGNHCVITMWFCNDHALRFNGRRFLFEILGSQYINILVVYMQHSIAGELWHKIFLLYKI